ncbi:HAMP domain-containing sensor histidine kinase [Saccharibacillus sp. JS10]|uniref:sensor histidine kinase n=1 Tax=Saccharibacillus sp. JS10 TaxID=2950552 RepID=UPI00210DB3C5|nr:HAMP domain-containing sensor histidine kinase [Saccharibacillus sp. JS10]MCQ4087451.1 HAMP domain-containing histidine kinase [Saccharibacillus sp. JS10]
MKKIKVRHGKFRHSLMARYLMLVGFAIFLLPMILIVVLALYLGYTYLIWKPQPPTINPQQAVSTSDLEKEWHDLATKLDGASPTEIMQTLRTFRAQNPLVQVVATDNQGDVLVEQPTRSDLPEVWTPGDAIAYMKQTREQSSQNFTVVAFIGEKPEDKTDAGQGFLIAEVSRQYTNSAVPNQEAKLPQIVAVLLFVSLFLLFAFMSWAFFYRIRKRLIRLQEAMTAQDEVGIPLPVSLSKQKDEVGALEGTFNEMVHKLRDGREREQQEEELRKKLIANLSHDLRTPLTVIRSHAYSLESEPLGERGQESLQLMSRKLDDLGGLIDNLLSYTLIAAGRYPMRLEETDVLRIVRTAAAQWYPVFEKEGIQVDADLPEEAWIWQVDREWLMRILDNLFQNVVRHAKDGQYIGLSVGKLEDGNVSYVQISDKGQGLPEFDRLASKTTPLSPADGAGIGLSIVELMIREMGMDWQTDSRSTGTIITIYSAAQTGR